MDVEPGPLSQIKYLYDIGGDSIFAPMDLEEDAPLDALAPTPGGIPDLLRKRR